MHAWDSEFHRSAFYSLAKQSNMKGHVNIHKSTVLEAHEQWQERYYLRNFQGPDYHLGNFKELKTLHGSYSKMPEEKVRVYVINSAVITVTSLNFTGCWWHLSTS